MSQPVVGQATNLTATGAVGSSGRDCAVLGFYVNSTTAGTIIFNVAGSAVSGTITPAIGWHNFPLSAPGGCTVTIGATLNVTVFSIPGLS
jgi:hypothetical protein